MKILIECNFEELLLAVRDASNSGLSEEAALYPWLTCLQPLLWRRVEFPERQQTNLTGWE